MTNHTDASIPLTYRDAGVDIEAGHALINRIKPLAKRTYQPGVITGLGGFSGMFELPLTDYKQPVLVASTDGVGTKLRLAIELGIHNTIGIDLVAMCVNDIVVSGAKPLFFLDYYATGQLDVAHAESIISGIADGCHLAGVALIGGETAEMPGMYHGNDYDLAGFCVGIVEKNRVIDKSQVNQGDMLLGLASSGVHANGYSLIRKVMACSGSHATTPFADSTLGMELLSPTKIYVKSLLALQKKINVHAISHITGGGLLDNIPRVLPDYVQAVIDAKSWQRPAIFDWLQQQGNIANEDMYRTFNNGIGMVICVAEKDVAETLSLLTECGETAYQIGYIVASNQKASRVVIS